MSVGDIKGARRRHKQRMQNGIGPFPRGKNLSVSESVRREKEKAQRAARIKAARSK